MSQTSTKKRILVVDDHPIVRQGLSQLIAQEPDLVICGEAESSTQALRDLTEKQPHIVILDLSLGQDDGFELIKTIRRDYPGVFVLVLTMHDETYFAERALRAGATGYVTKQEAGESVLFAIRSLLEGAMYVSDQISPKLIKRLRERRTLHDDPLMGRLSNRERQVFTRIGRGDTVQEIAQALGLGVKTVETYRAKIREKLDLRDSMELKRYAVRWILSRESE